MPFRISLNPPFRPNQNIIHGQLHLIDGDHDALQINLVSPQRDAWSIGRPRCLDFNIGSYFGDIKSVETFTSCLGG